jgi:HSP20 family protein
MELMRWRPAGHLGLNHRMNRLFDDFFAPITGECETATTLNWHPVVDVFEKDDNIVIKAELPGVEKKDIHIDMKGNMLTLSGERSVDNEASEEKSYRRERSFGKFVRSFHLADGIDPEKINAEYKEGILRLEIPKPEVEKPKQITVH